MFYHARVVSKPQRAKESAQVASEHDLTSEDLLTKIALPFVRGIQFFCGGAVVHPSQVQEVRFSRTHQSARDLAPFILARRKMYAVASFASPETDVIWEGENITRQVLDEAARFMTDSVEIRQKKSDRVFIVHGHDENAVDQTELLVRRFGLTPIILREAPSGGRTVIEKFEAHSNVGVAIVLLTPDDFGGKDIGNLLPRARQNVIWEWGYLVAKLGRENVICLYKQGVEMPSDLHGLVTIHFEGDVRAKAEEIRRELNAAGYEIR
ncbi:MAG TPA: nucleotide-binding protein [Candidatus Angelobacter sp.]|nr:nucleotide-binding protein [Candidatus Angelobacter sp.]